MAKKKIMMVEKPKDSETFEEFEKSLQQLRKTVWLSYHQSIIFCILKKHMKTIREICKQIVVNFKFYLKYFKFNIFPLIIFLSSSF